jgi:hypothetical protein
MHKTTYRKFTPGNNKSGPATYDAKSRSIQACIATEQPIEVYDFYEGQTVKEILLLSGLSWPDNGRVPLCDSHQRYSTKNVLGSCRNIRVESGELISDIHFSDDAAGQAVEKKYADGHLTDLSIGAEILEYENVDAGKTFKINGQSFEGPLRVITKSRLFETSAVPLGPTLKQYVRSKKIMENETNDQIPNPADPAEIIRLERESGSSNRHDMCD